jgi:Uma2 family endonuclease
MGRVEKTRHRLFTGGEIMSALPKKKLMTAEELYWLPDDGKRRELVKGELREMPPASGRHGIHGGRLQTHLGHYILTKKLGEVFLAETGFTISRAPDTVRAPDIAFVSQDRLPDPLPDGYFEIVPDLTVEIVSPNDTNRKVRDKIKDWLDAGVRLLWVVDYQKRTITEYRSRQQIRVLKNEDTLEGGDVVPGFSLPVREVFD